MLPPLLGACSGACTASSQTWPGICSTCIGHQVNIEVRRRQHASGLLQGISRDVWELLTVSGSVYVTCDLLKGTSGDVR